MCLALPDPEAGSRRGAKPRKPWLPEGLMILIGGLLLLTAVLANLLWSGLRARGD